ncbi:MAG: 3-oxoadipate enol-lactonase, partial [Betaproteobacteria bacterium]|nr:3-oxoadipate enol-lactonase [Betaproteobacteria bacterium]
MPYLELSRDYRMFYKIDDFTDPWTRPETVLLVHGFPESTEAWRAWIPHLARHFRCIRIDRRGFGQSGPVPKDFNYTDELFVDDLVRVIEGIGGGPLHIIGAKSGGIDVVKLAVARSDLAKTITIISTPVE